MIEAGEGREDCGAFSKERQTAVNCSRPKSEGLKGNAWGKESGEVYISSTSIKTPVETPAS